MFPEHRPCQPQIGGVLFTCLSPIFMLVVPISHIGEVACAVRNRRASISLGFEGKGGAQSGPRGP